MKELLVRIAKLLCVKSLVTLVLTCVFAYLSISEKISSHDFLTVFSVVIAFYFGSQTEKNTVVERKHQQQ